MAQRWQNSMVSPRLALIAADAGVLEFSQSSPGCCGGIPAAKPGFSMDTEKGSARHEKL